MQRPDPLDTTSRSRAGTAGAAAAATSGGAAAVASSGPANAAAAAAAAAEQQQKTIVDPLVSALWGVVPIAARMFMPDAKEGATPLEKQFLVPRQGFLLFHMDVLRAHFSPYAANIHSLWLSIRDERTGVHAYVPWYLPTHVIVDRVMTRSDKERETHQWGKSVLPLVVYVHFTLPPALKKKQRADLCATPETLLTLKDQPGIATLHLYRWLKEVYITRFNDTEGFEGESREAGRALGLRILKAAKDNDPTMITGVKRDVQKRSAVLSESCFYCVVIHTFLEAAGGEKPQWRSKTVRLNAAGRTFGRILPEVIPELQSVPGSVLAKDENLPVQHGAVFVQGLQPILTTPFDVLAEMYLSVDLALHIVWRPPGRVAL